MMISKDRFARKALWRVVLLSVVSVPWVRPQSLGYRFEHLTTAQGLSYNAVTSICQDHEGFMWFGTPNGLNKYDGYSFTLYGSVPSHSRSTIYEDRHGTLWTIAERGTLFRLDRILDRFVSCPVGKRVHEIHEDASGTIWVATRGDGLMEYKRADNSFVTYRHQSGNDNSLSNDTVYTVCQDREGSMWVGTQSGLDRVDVTMGSFEHTTLHGITSVMAILEDKEGTLWAGAADGLYKIRDKGKSIEHFKNKSREWSSIEHIFENRRNELWLMSEGGISRFDRATNRFKNYERYSRTVAHNSTIAYRPIYEDRRGRLWVLFASSLGLYDRQREDFMSFSPDQRNQFALSDDVLLAMYEDRAGTLWFGTASGGVDRINPSRKPFAAFGQNPYSSVQLSSNTVTAMQVDHSGNLWAGTPPGLDRFMNATGVHTFFSWGLKNYRDQGLFASVDIVEESPGKLWLATWGDGLVMLDVPKGRFTRYLNDSKNPSSLSYNEVSSICIDRSGIMWVATMQGMLERFDRQRGTFTHYQYDTISWASVPAATTGTLYEDKSSTLWICTRGLAAFDPNTESFTYYRSDSSAKGSLSSDEVLCLLEDSRGVIWVGTVAGLNRFDRATKTFTGITEKDGLASQHIRGILEDDGVVVPGRGRVTSLWLLTTKGLSKYTPETGVIKNYGAGDGVPISAGIGGRAYCKSKSGELFFGGVNGFVRFYPDSIRDNPYVPPIVITAIVKNNRPVELDSAVSEKRCIVLSYRDNVISFEFAALNYTSPEKNQFAYQLVGFDTGWVYCGTQRKATYTNLDGGEYVFKVKGSNNDGVWNEVGTSIAVTITPPPWKTNWAYIAYALVAGGALLGIRRYQIKRINARHNLEMMQLEARTLREVDEMKSHFFASISHEFRTPLTLIEGPVLQLLEGDVPEGIRRQYRLILRNSHRLLKLVNQLLDLSRAESGRMRLRTRSCDLLPIVRNASASFESLAARKRVRFSLVMPETPLIGYFDEDKVEKILSNLLSNAFKFTPEGGEVGVEIPNPTSQIPNQVVITVSDTGIGIAPEHQTKIFDRFYQVDDTSTRSHEGTGIGLALTKELVLLHKGTIIVESEPGRGSTFTVELPLDRSLYSDEEIATSAEGPGVSRYSLLEASSLSDIEQGENTTRSDPGNEENSDRPVVLIVEDNPDMRGYIRRILEEEYRLYEEEDGHRGVARAIETQPELIISDVMMPGMSGLELCRTLKSDERTKHIPVILLTAKAGEKEMIDGLETGADEYIVKPFNQHELRVRMKNLIGQRHVERLRHALALERERARISQDMHDEVGARLTEIGILSELVKKEIVNPEKALSQAQRISETSREVIANIGEIIWAMNPEHNRLDDLVAYLRQYTSRFLEPTGMSYRFESPDEIPVRRFTAEERRNIFLVVKEALNNVVKHSGADEVLMGIVTLDGGIEICIKDNGQGFDMAHPSQFGNGLRNMEKRMSDIGGSFSMHSEKGKGTKVKMAIGVRS